METNGKGNLSPSDFDSCPVWKYDEGSDLFYPVSGEKDLPELTRDLIIRAVFTTPGGDRFEGYIVGVERVFSMALFLGGRVYHVNRNMPGPSREQIDEFLSNKGGASTLTFDSMFPLRFETSWESETFANFSGVFEMS